MDFFNGFLSVPPDRTPILGRAAWKSRYVVLGRPGSCAGLGLSPMAGSSRPQGAASKQSESDEPYLAIFKSKDDREIEKQFAVSSITTCEIETIAHRKHESAAPTLVITISDKNRRRRSSRATGLITGKDSNTSVTLWFRPPAPLSGNSSHRPPPGLQDWARAILDAKSAERQSVEIPFSPTFTHPFIQSRPPSGHVPTPSRLLTGLQQKASSQTPNSRDRELDSHTVGSESPSLRSRRSDISSPSSSTYPSNLTYSSLSSSGPGSIPTLNASTTSGSANSTTSPPEYATFARSRNSTVTGSYANTDASAVTPEASKIPTSPPTRESLLDRAFQLRFIPGSDRVVPGDEALTSVARFDALMREADGKRQGKGQRRQLRENQERDEGTTADKKKERRTRDVRTDVASEDDGPLTETDSRHSKSQCNPSNGSSDQLLNERITASRGTRAEPLISANAQRALEFIAGRNHPSADSNRPLISRTPFSSLNLQTSGRSQGTQQQSQPHSYHQPSKSPKPSKSPRPSQSSSERQQLAAALSRPHAAHPRPRPSTSKPKVMEVPSGSPRTRSPEQDLVYPCSGGVTARPNAEKRKSGSSVKRLSLTDFAKRLSSTGSLLLIQPNTSGESSPANV